MATHASEPRRGITQTWHRPRHRSGSRGIRNAAIVCALGLAVAIAGLADPKVDGPAAVVIGVVIMLVGVRLLTLALPGSGKVMHSRALLRSTPEGVVLEGETMDTTVPWAQFRRLTGELSGASLEVWLERTAGGRLAVTALYRRSLLSEGARTRALAELEQLNTRLTREKTEHLERPDAGQPQP